jgi:two-component system sensor histidine kinase QseC
MTMMKNTSLKRHLMITILVSFLLTCLAANAVSLYQIKKSIEEVFDTQLLYFARRIASSDMKDLADVGMTRYIIGDQPDMIEKYMSIEDDALTFAIFDTGGKMVLSDGEDSKNFAFNQNVLGEKDGVLIEETRKYKIVWMLGSDRNFVVAVGQEKDYVDDVFYDTLQIQAVTWLIAFPAILLIVAFLIHDGLRPIQKLTDVLRHRSAEERSSIESSSYPEELKPFVEALNSLFERVTSLIARERRFTSNAAHELKTPLAALKIQAEVAQLSKDDAACLAHALGNLIAGVDRATRLIEQMMTLSRLESLESIAELEKIDWVGIIDSVMKELEFRAKEKNMRMEFRPAGEFKKVSGAPFAIASMIRNLLDNAIKYNDDGALIKIELGYDQLVIEDNGIGIRQEILENIGDRFCRPGGQKQSGSGLGFSIVKQIAHLHDYRINFYNVQGGGFKIVIKY